MHIGKILNFINKGNQKYLVQALQPFGLTYGNFEVLLTISDYDKEIGQNELGRLIFMNKAQVTRAVKQLLDGGFIKIESTEKHKRKKILALSSKGKKTVPEIQVLLTEWYAATLNNFSNQETEQLEMLLLSKLNNIRKIEENNK